MQFRNVLVKGLWYFFSDIAEPGFYVYVCVHIYATVAFVIALSYPSLICKTTLVHFSVSVFILYHACSFLYDCCDNI